MATLLHIPISSLTHVLAKNGHAHVFTDVPQIWHKMRQAFPSQTQNVAAHLVQVSPHGIHRMLIGKCEVPTTPHRPIPLAFYRAPLTISGPPGGSFARACVSVSVAPLAGTRTLEEWMCATHFFELEAGRYAMIRQGVFQTN